MDLLADAKREREIVESYARGYGDLPQHAALGQAGEALLAEAIGDALHRSR